MRRALQAKSRENLQTAVHRGALLVAPILAAFGAWGLYAASGWGPGGVGGDVRGGVLAWIGASVVVLAVQGARFGDVTDPEAESAVPEHPLRYLIGYAAVFSGYLLLVLALVLVPLALVLSI